MSACGTTTGVVYVHSSPAAVCPHIEWAIGGVLGTRCELRWTAQPAAPGQLRAEYAWTAEAGTGARFADTLRAWPMLRFEVTEDPSGGTDGERFCHVPDLGLWRARAGANGDIMVTEDQLRSLVANLQSSDTFRYRVEELLGVAWDEALEPYRRSGEGAPVAWLHGVG